MISYEQHLKDVRRRRRELWRKILNSEPVERAPGRRPRDPDKERILLRLDRARLRRREERGELQSSVQTLPADHSSDDEE